MKPINTLEIYYRVGWKWDRHVFRAGKWHVSVNVAEWHQVAAPAPTGSVLWILTYLLHGAESFL